MLEQILSLLERASPIGCVMHAMPVSVWDRMLQQQPSLVWNKQGLIPCQRRM